MKDKKNKSAPGKSLLLAWCMLFVPVILFADNHAPGLNVAAIAAITCPADIVQDNDPGQCDAVVNYTAPNNAYLVYGLPPGSMFPAGVTFVQYNLNDDSDSCSFTVTVNDTEPPLFFSCPEDIRQSYDDGICQAIDYELPQASDNCALDTIYQQSGLPPGSVFPVGTTVNTFVAEDTAGNQAVCSFSVAITGSNSTLLRSDGSSSDRLTPQGKLRYQRAFYLVTAGEMDSTDLEAGMDINAIGFTLAVAQDQSTTGDLKVYLQNTADTASRIDDDWITETTATPSFDLSIAAQGEYEWRVRALCAGNSDYSDIISFENDKLGSCNQPFNLETSNITPASATFNWELTSPSGADSVLLIYGISQSSVQDSVYTTQESFSASGLEPETNYQWRVRTLCADRSSPFSESSFLTTGADLCNEPVDLVVEAVTENTAMVSWTEGSSSSHYELSYRRSGTSFWNPAISFNDHYTFNGLTAGTYYQWRVRTVCPDGKGAYVNGPEIITSGTLSCYAPEGLKTSDIAVDGASLSWLAQPNATSYEISYRLKESITWTNAIDGMTAVSDGQISIPDTIGPYDIPFESGSTFTYDGDGLYIAWEYSNISGSLSSGNTALCSSKKTTIKGANGLDSAKYYLSFDGRSDTNSTTQPATLRANTLRPETRLGSPALQDSLSVAAVYAPGHIALPYGSPVVISALVKNYTDKEQTIPVDLDIYNAGTGDLIHSQSKELIVDAACGALVTFDNWNPIDQGMDSIVVHVPALDGENAVDNNRAWYIVDVNTVMQGYDDDSPALNGAGLGDGEGLILSKITMNGCGKVNSAGIFLHWSAQGHSLYAAILDESGAILDISESITPDSTMVNKYRSFYFPNTPELHDEDFYIGLAQSMSSGKPYYPVGVQWEGKDVRQDAFYSAALDGSGLINHSYPGRLMIQAGILPAIPVPFINGSDVLCSGAANTLQAAGKSTRYADKVIGVSSQYNNTEFGAIQALGSPDVYPAYGADASSWIGQFADLQREYIILHFPDPAPINFIDIYQTLNPGAIDTVYIKNDLGAFEVVFSDTARAGSSEASLLSVSFGLTSYNVSEIRIALGSDSVAGHHGIDAVGIGQITDPASYDNYLWQPGGETSSSIDITLPGKYYLTVSNADGCSLSDSLEVTTPVISTPTISLSGPAEFCLGDSVVLTSSEPEGNTWSTGETTQSIVVDTTGTYFVTYFNGCESATSADVSIISHLLPGVSITGGAICPGGSATLTAGGGFNSYVWSTGDSSQSITVSVPDLYRVYVTDDNGCEGTGTKTVFYATAPAPVISGDPYHCPGDSSMLDAGSGYASYLWSTGDTAQMIYVKSSTTVSVMVSNQFGCTGTASITTGEYIPPQPFISGALSLCYGSATVLDAGEGYASYLWSTGETGRSIAADTADTFTVYVTDANGCEGSASATTNLDGAIPDVPGPVSGPVSGVCQQNGLVYSIDPVLNTTHYVWTVPDGMTIVDGQGTISITVDAGLVTTGKISVAASNTCGQSPTWNGQALTLTGTPGEPAEIYGQATGVCGLSGIVYHTDPVFGTSDYVWTVPPGAAIINGQGTASITVNYDVSFVSGTITVAAENGCGPGNGASMMVTSEPMMPLEVYGPEQVCRKEKNVEFHVDPVFNAGNYVWTVPQQANIKSGQGTTVITVDFGNKSGFVSVYAENDCGRSSLQMFSVDVVPCDNQGIVINTIDPPGSTSDNPYLNGSLQAFYPEIIANAGDFASGRFYTISWTIGEPVIETREAERTMITQGFHQGQYLILPLGNTEEDLYYDVKVFPVPTRDMVNINVISRAEQLNLLIEVVDQIGGIVYREEVHSREFTHTIDLGHYPSNTFLLRVTDTRNNEQRLFKIIKLK